MSQFARRRESTDYVIHGNIVKRSAIRRAAGGGWHTYCDAEGKHEYNQKENREVDPSHEVHKSEVCEQNREPHGKQYSSGDQGPFQTLARIAVKPSRMQICRQSRDEYSADAPGQAYREYIHISKLGMMR